MTVSEAIGDIERCLLYHEVGHLIVARQVGFRSGTYIEFVPGGHRNRARCHYSATDADLDCRVITALAGMVAQVRLSPDSVKKPLRERIGNGRLFADSDITDRTSEVRKSLESEGLDGDIEDRELKTMGVLDFVSAAVDKNSEGVRKFILKRERKLHEMFRDQNLLEQIKNVACHIDMWVRETDVRVDGIPVYLLSEAELSLEHAHLI